jgi:hypothetical protein
VCAEADRRLFSLGFAYSLIIHLRVWRRRVPILPRASVASRTRPSRSMGRVGDREVQHAATVGAGTGGARTQRKTDRRHDIHVECDRPVPRNRTAPGADAGRARVLSRGRPMALERPPTIGSRYARQSGVCLRATRLTSGLNVGNA